MVHSYTPEYQTQFYAGFHAPTWEGCINIVVRKEKVWYIVTPLSIKHGFMLDGT